MLNSVNCSTVICSRTVEYLCSREKPLVKPMAPGSIFIILIPYYLVISFAIHFAFILLCIFYHKNTKNIILSYLSDLTLISDRVGIDNPISCRMKMVSLKQPCNQIIKGLLCPQPTKYNGKLYRCTSSAKRW